jgi:PKD repeat protein
LRSPNDAPALLTAAGAHHWRVRYLEFAANHNGYSEIIRLGDGTSAQRSTSTVPHHFILEHLYIHGDPLLGQKRGVSANASYVELRDSHISEIKAVGQDTQAFGAYNGPGPFLLENNYLEAAGENVLFGGADPYILNLVADGIVIRRNLFSRPMSWMQPIVATPQSVAAVARTGGALGAGTYAYRVVARRPAGQINVARSTASLEATASISAAGGAVRVTWKAVPDATEYRIYGRTSGTQSMYWTVKGTEFTDTGSSGTAEAVPTTAGTMWTVKNLFELKNARNVLVEANIFQNHWKHAQAGYSIVYTPRNSGGTCTWCVVENVTFQWNLVRNVASGINILGYDNTDPSAQASHLTFRQNLFYDVKRSLGGNAWFLMMGDEPRDITIEHNTFDSDGSTVVNVYGGTSTDPREVYGFKMTDNASRHGSYGMGGSYFSYGLGILTNYYPGYVFQANYLAGGSASRYPAGTLLAGLFEDQFVNAGARDYNVRPGSALYRGATDGTDIGVDFPALMAAISGVEAGVSGTGSVPPTASFTATCAGLTCSFTDTSSDADGAIAARNWSFADGSSSTLSNPTHTFAGSGSYVVTLSVTDDDGNESSASQAVAVTAPNQPPVASFTWSCTGLTCAFADSSADPDGTIANRLWAFGDGSTSTSQNPSKTFAAAGTYSVTLTATDDDGATASLTKSVTLTTAASVHIGDLDGRAVTTTAAWQSQVTITVHDATEAPVEGAVVKFKWSGGVSAIGTCTTLSTGQCVVMSPAAPLSGASIKLTVNRITSTRGTYLSSANHDPDGSSNGTGLRVWR